MSYTPPASYQWYATADDLINKRGWYSIEGVPVPTRQEDGRQEGFFKSVADQEARRNYQNFYNQHYGHTNKFGKKQWWSLKPEYERLQQIISDRFNIITYKPNDQVNQSKNHTPNTKISTKPIGIVKEAAPEIIDPRRQEFEDILLEKAGGRIEPPVSTIDTSGDAFQSTFFPVIPEAAAEPQLTLWWIKKPSGIIERINISEVSKRKAESIGWIFNKNNIWKDQPEDKTITSNMITQHLDHFTIENGRAKGQITFTLNDNFNPFYYGKDIVNIIQFKTKAGANILPFVKQNRLRFTETERDEVIQYDEAMQNNTVVDMESFVWLGTTTPTAFSSVLRSEIKEGQAAAVTSEGFMAAGITGAIALLIGIGLILPERGGKK